jgi:hypothetical protein
MRDLRQTVGMPHPSVVLVLFTLFMVRGVEAQAPSAPLRVTTTVRIDGATAVMSWISTVRSGPEGTILIGQPSDTTILVFSAAGQQLRRIGRSGSGPGDLRSLDGFGVFGDTIWVADNTLGRVTLFDVRGRVLRTILADTGRSTPTLRFMAADTVLLKRRPRLKTNMPIALSGSDRGIGMLEVSMFQLVWNTAGPVPVFAARSNGTPLRVLAWLPHRHSVLGLETIRAQSIGAVWTNQPFADDPVFTVSPLARRVVVAASSVNGRSGTVSLTHIAPTGDTLARHAVPFTPRPIPRAFADSVIAERTKGLGNTPPPEGWRARAHVPPYYTGAYGIVASDDGSVWIQPYCDGLRCVWTVVAPNGRIVGTVDVPSRTRIVSVDTGGPWAIEVDADGIESVVRYRVSPAGGR